MDALIDAAQPAAANLLESDEETLYEELGLRLEASRNDPAVPGAFQPTAEYDAESMGPLEDIRDFGRRFFKRVNGEAYEVLCGAEERDKELRQKVSDAFGLGQQAVVAAIAAALVGGAGFAPAIAAVLAALVFRIVAPAAYDAMCATWKDKVALST